ncbi:MAG: glycosyltransferase family 1 protein, partial [Planctomycetota bacterium]
MNRENNNTGKTTEPRMCVFSMRNVQGLVSRCACYEFEDVLSEIDRVNLLAPEPSRSNSLRQKMSNRLARHASIAGLNPGVKKLGLEKNYDLFLANCFLPTDLLALNVLKGWRQRCGTTVCWLHEIWAWELRKWKGHLKILSQFDYIILSCSASVRPVQNAIQKPCLYVPYGVDTIRFCPYPHPPARSIDVYSIGRRSPVTHQAL